VGPSGHLLRTLAAVAPGARVVCLGPVGGAHAAPLARLGFDVWASAEDPAPVRAGLADVLGEAEAARRTTASPSASLGYPNAYADWVALAPAGPAALGEAARVLRPGGWVWAEAARGAGLTEAARAAGLVVAEPPAADVERGTVHAVYRRPGAVG
jgi:hypothetical protein